MAPSHGQVIIISHLIAVALRASYLPPMLDLSALIKIGFLLGLQRFLGLAKRFQPDPRLITPV